MLSLEGLGRRQRWQSEGVLSPSGPEGKLHFYGKGGTLGDCHDQDDDPGKLLPLSKAFGDPGVNATQSLGLFEGHIRRSSSGKGKALKGPQMPGAEIEGVGACPQ